MMAVSKEISTLRRLQVTVTRNNNVYVYKSTYYNSKETQKISVHRVVGPIVNGVFTYAKVCLKQPIRIRS